MKAEEKMTNKATLYKTYLQALLGIAPTPFATFLASLVTCAGIYVLGFCRQRGLDTSGIRLIQRLRTNPLTGLVGNVEIDIQVPPSFPEK